MAPQPKTPGVYIVEKNAFPNAVVQVPTAVPAFIGHTERAQRGAQDVTGKPVRLSSLNEYEGIFGGAPPTQVTIENDALAFTEGSRFLLFHAMRMFFQNGGSNCYVVSVGNYEDAPTQAGLNGPLADDGPLAREAEPTMVVIPDAVLLEFADWQGCSQQMLKHCIKMQSRVAILDVHNGDAPRNDQDDVITQFRTVKGDRASFGIGYYPWVNTSLYGRETVSLDDVDADARDVLGGLVEADRDAAIAQLPADDPRVATLTESFDQLAAFIRVDSATADADEATNRRESHLVALQISPSYRDKMDEIREFLNVMPPAAAMAGVYSRIDNLFGVFKAPANTPIFGVISPTVSITANEQEDLNVPFQGGIAVNAIRTFINQGVLVWGARTMDGNSQDWRYVNVRRTAIMLEQSMKNALNAYVFAPNTASTWTTVRNMLLNFLDNQWKAGALMGATPEDAYAVDVGLGTTMTPNDVLDGYMRIVVRVALVRPAEFIILTFQQKMPTS
ncbi:MAG: phage tail sheath C-terminal domain-containing protein [Pseudomonadota bacterium]